MRCEWCLNDPLNQKYHDEEWGKPFHDDHKHFELLTLELMQSGLSWITILRKREAFRRAFHNFNLDKVKAMKEQEVERLVNDASIIRHRKKIEAVINNAERIIEIQKEQGSFDAYIWSYVKGQPLVSNDERLDEIPSKNHLSKVISTDLKKRGFKFLGETTVYSYLQASGIINDHLSYCKFKWTGVE